MLAPYCMLYKKAGPAQTTFGQVFLQRAKNRSILDIFTVSNYSVLKTTLLYFTIIYNQQRVFNVFTNTFRGGGKILFFHWLLTSLSMVSFMIQHHYAKQECP